MLMFMHWHNRYLTYSDRTLHNRSQRCPDFSLALSRPWKMIRHILKQRLNWLWFEQQFYYVTVIYVPILVIQGGTEEFACRSRLIPFLVASLVQRHPSENRSDEEEKWNDEKVLDLKSQNIGSSQGLCFPYFLLTASIDTGTVNCLSSKS